MEHVEVLRDIRYSFTKLGGDAADVAALDAAIAALSAPQPPAEAQPDREPADWPHQDWKGMDGAIAWHLIDRHASGWQAVGEMMDAWLSANSEQPPSAPVGVETVDAAAWIEVLELPEGFRVAEHLPGIWEYQFDIEDESDEDSDRMCSGTSWNHPALAAIAAWQHVYDEALAQQPAAYPRSTHHVHRATESLPCYCPAKDDHPIGSEQPAAVDEAQELARWVLETVMHDEECDAGTTFDDDSEEHCTCGCSDAFAMCERILAAQQPAAVDEGCVDWRDMYRFQTAMRYMDNNPELSRERAYKMADADCAALAAQQGGAE